MKLKTFKVYILREDYQGMHPVLAVNEEEALLMREYINNEGWEA
jgi:hypothetical protein